MNRISTALFDRAKKVSPGGVHSPVRAFSSVGGDPLFFSSAEGAFLHSVDGQRYIDFCQSFGPNILGHRDPDVARVVHETCEMAWTLGACEPYSLDLAEWITERIPWVEKLRFVCSGTEAVMSVLRIARAATGRDKIVKFEGCYHGHSDAMLVKAGSGLAGEALSDSAGVDESLARNTLVAPLNDEGAIEKIFETHGNDIAALIIEPLPANYGLLVQRPEFIQRVCEIARQHGALVIFDEVISGFRVALGGMAEKLSIEPDLVTYGKILGGGFPVGAYGGRADLINLVAPIGPVYQAGTLAANPIGMRAGLATLKKIEQNKVYDELEKNCAIFCSELADCFRDTQLPLEITREGSLFWIHAKAETPIRSIDSIPASHKVIFRQLFDGCLSRGVYFAPHAFEVSFLSYAHSPEVINLAVGEIRDALHQIKLT